MKIIIVNVYIIKIDKVNLETDRKPAKYKVYKSCLPPKIYI